MSQYGHPSAAAKNATYGLPPSSQASALPQAGFPQQETGGQSVMTPAFGAHAAYVLTWPVYDQPAAMVVNLPQQKPKRATQACELCRQRKQRCDEGNPCSFCKESSLTCQYRDTPPAKTDKKMDTVVSLVEGIVQEQQGICEELDTGLSALEDRLRHVEQQSINSSPALSSEPSEPEEPAPKHKQELDDHRTAPHKLILLWPSVRPLLQEAEVDVNDGYVMEAEDRGVLRLYGRGEGIEEQGGTQSGGPARLARGEDSFSDAPSPPERVWGCGLPSYEHLSSEPRAHQHMTAGGLKPDGTLDLDQTTINTLWESYVKHIHAMHPFLDKSWTRGLLDDFISRYGTRSHDGFVSVDGETDRPLKGQRSSHTGFRRITAQSTTEGFVETERSPSNALIYLVLALGKICAHDGPLPGPVQESVSNANASLPHRFSGGLRMHGAPPTPTNVESSSATPTATPDRFHTPRGHLSIDPVAENGSHRSSFGGSSSFSQTAKNMDIIPGIAYYSKAAAILGEQGDANDLIHAQIFLLAGLYKGQLARVKESMSRFFMAGRAVLTLLDQYKLYNDKYWNNYWTAHGDVRKKHEHGRKLIADKRQNLIVLAAWTCLQLESDILAELRLSSSGIQDIEDFLLMPHGLAEEETYEDLARHKRRKGEINNDIMMFYTAQMYLRKRLNQVHRELYGPECLNLPPTEVRAMLDGHQATLDKWRASLPDALKWSDGEKPPPDILSARLRAKYWGAQYVVNRLFLDYALHIMRPVREGRSVEKAALDAHGNPRDKAEIHLFKAIQLTGEDAVWDACRRCIEAAMQSTVALDGVPGRLVVTNIHGTAHA